MAQQRSTFGKLQRDRDKKDKALAKAERREQRATAVPDEDEAPAAPPARDEADVLAALAALHASLEAGEVSIDDFETRRDQLRSQLQIN